MLSTGDACQIAHGKIPHADFMFACPIRTGLDYDSSSGLASSATSTSISSIYEEFASEWNTLPHISPPRGAANRFTLNQATLSRHPVVLIPSTPIAAPPQPANIYDKVMLWIKNQEKSSIRPPVLTETTTTTATTTMTTICDMTNWQPRTSSTVNADHMVTNSLVHTDSTSKTDQSNFTYFI